MTRISNEPDVPEQFSYPWGWKWSALGGRIKRHAKPRAARRMPQNLRRLLEKRIGRAADPETLPLFSSAVFQGQHHAEGGWKAHDESRI